MNILTFTGNLGKDAVQRFTEKGDSVVSFSVAVKSGFGQKASTFWTSCSLWGKRGESLLPYLNKGTPVTVSGELNPRKGEKDTFLDVRVNEVALHGGKEPKQEEAPAKAIDEEDVPF